MKTGLAEFVFQAGGSPSLALGAAYMLVAVCFAGVFLWNAHVQDRTWPDRPERLRANWLRRAAIYVGFAAAASAAWWIWQEHSQFWRMRIAADRIEMDFVLPQRTVVVADPDLERISVGAASRGGRAGVVICASNQTCWRSRSVSAAERCAVWKVVAHDRRLQGVQPSLCR